MAADLPALRRAADLLDNWAKNEGYSAMLNDTDPNADAGAKLYACILTSLVARARSEAADLRMRALVIEASPNGSEAPK